MLHKSVSCGRTSTIFGLCSNRRNNSVHMLKKKKIRIQCKHIYKKSCLAQSRAEAIQIPSRTHEVKHPILFDPGEILPKDYSIMPVKWPFIQAVPELHKLWCSQTHGGSPVTGAAPLQGAHTRLLLPAGDAVLVSIMGAWRAGWANIYTWKLLISGDWERKTIYLKKHTRTGFFFLVFVF